jgi:hypothetical protein
MPDDSWGELKISLKIWQVWPFRGACRGVQGALLDAWQLDLGSYPAGGHGGRQAAKGICRGVQIRIPLTVAAGA